MANMLSSDWTAAAEGLVADWLQATPRLMVVVSPSELAALVVHIARALQYADGPEGA